MKKTAEAKAKPRERAREVRNDFYRRHILEAAERVFAERGFENAKLQEISSAAGLSMGTIYAVFSSKDHLLGGILQDRGRELLALARRVADAGTSPREALRGLIDAYVGYFVEHPDFLRMHLRHGTSWVLGPTLTTSGQVQLWRDIHELQAAIFKSGVDSGDFVDEDPAFLAKIFSAMDQVLLSDWVAGGMRAGRDELVGRLQRLVERVFLKGDTPTPRKRPR